MNALRTLFLLAAALSVACCAPALSTNDTVESRRDRRVIDFRKQILCIIPDSSPITDFADYSCYCGLGGSGTPVDELDRCCQVHDNCYGEAMEHDQCRPIIDNPYTKIYSYNCDKADERITCGRECTETTRA